MVLFDRYWLVLKGRAVMILLMPMTESMWRGGGEEGGGERGGGGEGGGEGGKRERKEDIGNKVNKPIKQTMPWYPVPLFLW